MVLRIGKDSQWPDILLVMFYDGIPAIGRQAPDHVSAARAFPLDSPSSRTSSTLPTILSIAWGEMRMLAGPVPEMQALPDRSFFSSEASLGPMNHNSALVKNR
uniref:Uncharacterized protein n=1 Tax=Candidatus Kentrum sp. SD TaxID=2126332 RepID=A0A450YXY5_9GAMM|nr:MAG: hypothetical protein BECKSD772F_GA0070984_10706 [Candidatus Kentron sp. SD]VFK46383.1 MAG: hypothetical protein BECKSD772E_GA0070983_10726 [Candidatus Kentron sp. SD]VFK79498.1 MAG: hypothetical protein BECKSD772D_GA0070982_10529 [Candidatus Kentron sp. SD]